MNILEQYLNYLNEATYKDLRNKVKEFPSASRFLAGAKNDLQMARKTKDPSKRKAHRSFANLIKKAGMEFDPEAEGTIEHQIKYSLRKASEAHSKSNSGEAQFWMSKVRDLQNKR
jgi:hypothetical protein